MKNKNIDFSKYGVVFCDSKQAIEWAYQNGLSRSAIIKSSSPAVLWDKKVNINNVESRWSVDELVEFQSTIQEMSRNIFDLALSVNGVEREFALNISRSVFDFQKILYKAACLKENDFTEPRLFIHIDGETGPSGNMMNSPWDQLLSSNELFSIANYTLKNDSWKVLTTQGVSYWRRFSIAGYETIIYRLAIKLMKIFPDFMFTKEVLMPNENELNIEIASSLALRGVQIKKIQADSFLNAKNVTLSENNVKVNKIILPVVLKRVERWVTPSAVNNVMSLFESFLEKQTHQFESIVAAWDGVITKSYRKKQVVLVNCPGNIKGRALSYVCRKKDIPLITSQHGVTVEISEKHNMTHVAFDNSVANIVFSYNHKIVNVEKSNYFDNADHYVVGMPMRLIRMKNLHTADDKYTYPIVFISTNLYHMGFSISSNTDYRNAIYEYKIIDRVLSKLPHKVCYKTYPEDNRRYADIDPIIRHVDSADNIDLFSEKIDMRYLVSKYKILITTCATSTLGWPVMSGKPVVFINQKNNSPLTDEAFVSLSQGLFLFDDKEEDFYNKLTKFLSQPIEKIESLWKDKEAARKKMVRDFFTAYDDNNAGSRASDTIMKEYLINKSNEV